MSRWIRVAAAAEVADGRAKAVDAEGVRVALFRDGDAWYATEEACPHQGASLVDGTFHEGKIICPLHSWVFDAKTGKCPRESHEPVEVYPVRCDGEWVEVEIA